MTHSTFTLAAFLSAASFVLSTSLDATAATPAPSIRILIVTGADTHHDWRKTTPVLWQLLSEDRRFAVDVLSDLSKLKDAELKSYHSVIVHFYSDSAEVPGREAFEHLRQYVSEGGGMVIVHFGCGAFHAFKQEYLELAGRVWMGLDVPPGRRQHDPRGPFQVVIADSGHPITAGVTDFATDDELYTCLEGDEKISVLAVARSGVDGEHYPMAIAHEFHKGRVFLCTLGHDDRAFAAPGVGELYRRGSAWSAGFTPVAQEDVAWGTKNAKAEQLPGEDSQ